MTPADATSDPATIWRTWVDNLPEIAWWIGTDGAVRCFNERWYAYTGVDRQRCQTAAWFEAQGVIADVRATWEARLSTGEPFEWEHTLQNGRGDRRWFLSRACPCFTAAGALVAWFGTSVCIDRKQRERDYLLASEARYRTLLETPEHIVWTNTAEGEMQGEQPGWGHFTGQDYSAYCGYGWSDAIHPDDTDHTVARWRQAVTSKSMFSVEHRVRRRDGVYRLFDVRALPVHDDIGAIREWVGVHTDITERRHAEMERERLLAREQEAVRHRDQFLAIASHELRTPITSALLQLQLTRRQAGKLGSLAAVPEARLSKLIDVLSQQMVTLQHLVESLLDVSRIANGRLSIDRQQVDVVDLARCVVDSNSALLESVGSTVEVHAQHDAIFVQCDRKRIEQVLTNLLTNVYKYGAGKPAQIVLKNQVHTVDIQVIDHGLGIGVDAQRRVFEKFERAVNYRSISGLGLGLYIAMDIVKAHGGTIEVESELGRGSVFTVKLPRE